MGKTIKSAYFQKSRLGLILVGGFMSILLGFTLTPSFAALVASIQNSTNTAATGTLTMQETSGATTCNSNDGAAATTNTATCSTINKYGGTATALVPGGTGNTTTLTIKNTGSLAATSFTVAGGACTQSAVSGSSFTGGATDLCSKVNISIRSGSTTIYTGTAAAFASAGAVNILTALSQANVAAGVSVPITVTAALDASANATYQGLQISQPITWAFGA